MELKIQNGDYVPGSGGAMERLEGSAELVQRVLYQLTARRAGFPLLPELGSELHLLGRTAAGERASAAELAVRQALSDETELEITGVTLTDAGSGLYTLQVALAWRGQTMEIALTIQ